MNEVWIVTSGRTYPNCIKAVVSSEDTARSIVRENKDQVYRVQRFGLDDLTKIIDNRSNWTPWFYICKIRKFDLEDMHLSRRAKEWASDYRSRKTTVDTMVRDLEGWITAESPVSEEDAIRAATKAFHKAKPEYDRYLAHREVVRQEEIERLEAQLKKLKDGQ